MAFKGTCEELVDCLAVDAQKCEEVILSEADALQEGWVLDTAVGASKAF